MGGSLSCPSEFVVSPSGSACVLPCPAAKNYYMTSTGTALACTYSADPNVRVPLTPTPMYFAGQTGPNKPDIPANASYTMLENKSVYQAEIDRFTNAMKVADANIDSQLKLTTAFNALQAAENARDVAPDAYTSARIAYYTLIKGDKWVEEEKNRIANVEAQPIVNNVVAQYNAIKEKRDQQQSTIEVINGVRDRILSVKDDLEFSVKTFQKQIGDVKNQINKDKRDQTQAIVATTSWIDVLLNWLIAITTIIAIFFLARYIMRSRVQAGQPSTTAPR